jgi:putative ATPase
MKELNYGTEYIYPHDCEGSFARQEYLPDGLQGKKYYDPAGNDREEALRRYLKSRWGDKYDY